MTYYIGVLSGTSMDAIDVGIFDFEQEPLQTIGFSSYPYPEELKTRLLNLLKNGHGTLIDIGSLHIELGRTIGRAVCDCLRQHKIYASHIRAIGSHGQNLFHHPHGEAAFTWQVGDPNQIAEITGITTIADFRGRDIAASGQGAPLAPAFHAVVFQDPHDATAVVNIGGIANITLLPPQHSRGAILGYDTGPGNLLMDGWIGDYKHETYDKDGQWAQGGRVHHELLKALCSDPYFLMPAPKSTGREYFNLPWVYNTIRRGALKVSPQDVQRTLLEVTAQSIAHDVSHSPYDIKRALICGGGSKNPVLMERIQALLGDRCKVDTTSSFGLEPSYVEAALFAWLARETLNQRTGNIPSVTGAKREVLLGGVYYA